MAATIRLLATAFTHRGAVRAQNEDTVAVADRVTGGPMDGPVVLERELRAGSPPVVCLVADGLGGHAAGEVASRYAAERLAARVAAGEAADGAAVAALLRAVDAELDELARGRPGLRGMGTTVAGVVVVPGADAAAAARVLVFNVGDSRVYRVERGEDGGGRLVQLSTDDTPGPKLPDGRTAVLTTSQITQSLGGGAHAPGAVAPHVLAEAGPGAGAAGEVRYLICSDGLTDLVGRGAIAALLDGAGDDDRAGVRALFEAAMTTGGRDNVSLVMVRLRHGHAGGG